jgi:FlaA1/EpsC-like NDP-sugar epimerase
MFLKELNRYRFIAALALVHVSLIAAITGRFLVMSFFKGVGPGEQYQQLVHYSVVGYVNSIIPIILVGAVVFYSLERWIRPLLPGAGFAASLMGLSLFYGVMLGLAFLLRGKVVFPGPTWFLAWMCALLLFCILTAISRIDVETRNKIVYHRVHHLFIDVGMVAVAYYVAFIFRFDGSLPPENTRQLVVFLPYMILLYIGFNLLWRIYSFIWRMTSLREALVLSLSVGSSALTALLVRILFLESYPSLHIPLGVLLAQPELALLGMLAARVARRLQYNYLVRERAEEQFPQSKRRRVLLVGAGNAGMMLVRELALRPDFHIVGFLDDDPRLKGRIISGIQILGSTRQLGSVVREHAIQEVILSMPAAPKSAIRRITSECEMLGIATSSVPNLSEIILGKVRVSQLRPVRMEDLLGRASIDFPSNDRELIDSYGGMRILVTGAAGSIGSELVRQLKDFKPSQLILLDKDENGLYEIGLEIREEFKGAAVDVVADVRDRARMERIFRHWRPEAIFHAAAYKHVPMMEYNPSEAILNNVVGSRYVIDLACDYGAKSFLLISTDKAVNPTSVMGASKRVAEMIVRNRALSATGTRCCCVRFGNVLGSRASVVPLFQKRITEGKSIQVTHPDVKRYFMTIPEAVQLVIQAGSLGRSGETFMLDMGDPVKITDLARELIEQSGLVPDEDIKIEFTGLRPGEKLFEEILISTENSVRSTKYPKIFVADPVQRDGAELEAALVQLEEAARTEDNETIYRILRDLDIGYQHKTVAMVG